MRTERLQREEGIELRWSVFPLHPETPEEGQELSALFGRPPEEIRGMQARVLQAAQDAGLPMAERSRTFNSRRAQELGKWAEAQGKFDAYRQTVYHAFFVEGRNIAKVSELTAVAAGIGLSELEARRVLAEGLFAPAVEVDYLRAAKLGIRAVPTHLCGERRLVGYAPYSDFLALIGKAPPAPPRFA